MSLQAFMSASPKIWREQVAHAHEVVAGEGKQGGILHLVAATKLRAAQQADVFAPAEGLLDQLSRPQTQRVSGVASGACIDRRSASSLGVLCYVRGGLNIAHLRDKSTRIVCLVRRDRARAFARQ